MCNRENARKRERGGEISKNTIKSNWNTLLSVFYMLLYQFVVWIRKRTVYNHAFSIYTNAYISRNWHRTKEAKTKNYDNSTVVRTCGEIVFSFRYFQHYIVEYKNIEKGSQFLKIGRQRENIVEVNQWEIARGEYLSDFLNCREFFGILAKLLKI